MTEPKQRRGSPKESKPSAARKTILVVDDHPAVREGLAGAINPTDDLAVCGEAESAAQAMAQVAQLKPDAVLVDLSLQNSAGIELIKDLHSRYGGKLPVLVLSMHDETLYAERVIRAGARGYVMKHQPMRVVIEALRTVLSGKIYLSEPMTSRIMGAFVTSSEPVRKRSQIESLSDREMEVFELLSDGLAIREIAEILHLSKKTVSCYQQGIRRKLSLRNSNELIRYAVHWSTTDGPQKRETSPASPAPAKTAAAKPAPANRNP